VALENSLAFPKALARQFLRRYLLATAVIDPAFNGDDDSVNNG
jgi:hypothetical protein